MPKTVSTVSPADAGKRIDRWFKDHFAHVPFGRLQKSMRTGEIRLNGKRVKGNERIETGDEIRVPPFPPADATKPKPAVRLDDDLVREVRSWVLYEDDHMILVNKPPGLATQGGSGQGNRHLDAYLDAFDRVDGIRPKLVHRLDKDTSGVILIARTTKSAGFLAKAFQARTADKRYMAVTVGVPDPKSGEVRLKMEKAPGAAGEKMIVDDENGKPSRTLFSVVDQAAKQAALVALKPLTGRTHQLRLHLSVIGCPIAGDGKYGGQEAYLTGAISRKLHLHSHQLTIDHPDGRSLTVSAPPPRHFQETLDGLGFALRDIQDPFDDEFEDKRPRRS